MIRPPLPRLAACVAIAIAVVLAASPASAQSTGHVDIDFQVGDFDPIHNDWAIVAVEVSGDLDRSESFTVELRDGSGAVLWSGSAEYHPPMTSIDVGTFVPVGAVEEAAIAQRRPGGTSPTTADPPSTTQPPPTNTPTDPTDPTDPPDTTNPPGPTDPPEHGAPVPPDGPAVEGDNVSRPVRAPRLDEPDDLDPAQDEGEADDEIAAATNPPGTPPSVEGDVVTAPEQLPQQGSGAGGAGQLALSMVIAVVFVAILFRTPLPSATTVRWRK